MTGAIPNVLSIAGSDPCGGAGIQADLKTFAALGVYGMAALTALTAQNTRGVVDVHPVPGAFVRAQLQAVFEDIRVDAVKIGMAWNAPTIAAIADVLEQHRPPYVVLDPVMVASSGDSLLDPEAAAALKARLVPLATVLTPNLPEARALLGRDLPVEDAARALLDLGPGAVLLKGGHGAGRESVDILVDKSGRSVRLSAPRIETQSTHGTGCTLAAALAAFLAGGEHLESAARAAKAYITGAILEADALTVGAGHGPVHHGWKNQGKGS